MHANLRACVCVCMHACGFAICLCGVELVSYQVLAVSLDADKLFTSNLAQRQPMSHSYVFDFSTTAIY